MKKFLVCVAAVAMMGLSANSAEAALKIRLTELGGGGATVTVADGDAADTNPAAGVVGFSGPIGAFNITVTIGSSKPQIHNSIHLTSLLISNAPGSIRVEMTDTDFTQTPPIGGLVFQTGGVTAGVLSNIKAGADNADAEFSTATSEINLPNQGPGAFAATDTAGFTPDGDFSMSMSFDLTHTSAGATSFDGDLALQPEPGSLGLLGLGLCTLGMSVRRRRRN